MERERIIDVNKRKRVLFLTNIPSPYRVEFFDELGKYCDLTVLYEKKRADNRDWKYVKKANFTSVFMKGIKTGADHAICFEVLTYLKKDYDVIVVGGYSTPTGMLAIEYLRFKKIPFYLNCDGGFVRQESKRNYVIKKHFIKSATYWLSSGNETNKYLKHYGAIETRIFMYPFTSVREVDVLKEILPQEKKEELKSELDVNEEKMIVSVGQFIYRKGFDILIKASKILGENVGVYIIGGAPSEEYLQILQEYQVSNVHFVEFCDAPTLRKYYRAADCMAFPTREDIWGLVVNEALANGLPVVASDKCIAALDLVRDAGYIVQSDDVDALGLTLQEVMQNEQLQKEMAKKACMRAKDYTIENMARVHMEIFDKTTGN